MTIKNLIDQLSEEENLTEEQTQKLLNRYKDLELNNELLTDYHKALYTNWIKGKIMQIRLGLI